MLEKHDKPDSALDYNPDLITRGKRQGYHARFTDATRSDALDKAG